MKTNGTYPRAAAPGAGLRVCHLGKFYPPAAGGVESNVRTLALAQAALGADVTVLCVNHSDRHGRDVLWRAFAATPAQDEWDGRVRVRRLGRWASVARFDLCPELLPRLAQLSRERFDVLHLHLPNPTMLLPLALLRPRLPLVITYHGDVVRQKVLGLAQRPLEHFALGRAACILCSSPAYPEGSPLLRQYRDRLTVLPFGIDLTPYLTPGPAARAFARRLQEEHGPPLWLCVGRLVYYKGLANAIRALPQVPGKLLLIGEGPLKAELDQQARELSVADRVVWLGHVSDEEVAGAYQAATALWFPSNARSEAFGLVQVEAMASGCPVVNTAIPASGVAWVSRHEESGLTIPVNDPDALAAAANRLLHEPGLRERLAATARERARREFDHRVMAERCLDVYRRVVGRHSAAATQAVR